MSTASGKFVLHHRSDAVAFGSLDGFFVMRSFGASSPQDLQATLKGHAAALACRPSGVGSIVVLDPSASFPSEETRRMAHEVTRQTKGQVASSVLILLGDGFWASAIRGVVTTLNSMSPADHPKTVVRSEEQGVRWTIETLQESAAKYQAALLAALGELRSPF